jgi:hypothetical protein
MMMTTKQSVFVNAAIKGRKRQISKKAKRSRIYIKDFEHFYKIQRAPITKESDAFVYA